MGCCIIESLIKEINPKIITFSIYFKMDDEMRYIDNLSETDMISLLELLKVIKYDT